jgi:hypothetical protein
MKARRLPRFEALIPDELARCVDVENGAWSGIFLSVISGGPLVTMRRCFEKGRQPFPTGAE